MKKKIYLDEALGLTKKTPSLNDKKEDAFCQTMALNVLLRDHICLNDVEFGDLYVSKEHASICNLFDGYVNICLTRKEALKLAKSESKDLIIKYYGLDLFKKAKKYFNKYYDDGTQYDVEKLVNLYNANMEVLKVSA